MRKVLIILVSLIILSSFAIAEETPTTEENAVEATKTLREKTDAFAGKPITIPSWLQKPIEIVFRFEGNITVSEAIIAIMLLIVFAVCLIEILEVFSVFSDTTSIIIGLVLTIILSVTGFIRFLTTFLLTLGSQFQFLEKWGAGALVFWAVVLIVIFLIIRRVLGQAKEYQLLRIARRKGFERGLAEAEAKKVSKTLEEVGKG